VCVVLAAPGYPASPRVGEPITFHGDGGRAGDVLVFHGGTRRGPVGAGRSDGGPLITAAGRVLGVTARGADLGAARAAAYGAIHDIHFDGMHYRSDIGTRGEKR
jgi:phosphoribosylamine--glycine ligase